MGRRGNRASGQQLQKLASVGRKQKARRQGNRASAAAGQKAERRQSAGRKAGRLQGGRQSVGSWLRQQGRSAVAAGRYGRAPAGQGVTTGQQDAGSSTAGAMTGSRTHDDGRTRQGVTAK